MEPFVPSNKEVCGKLIYPFCPSYHDARQIFNRSIQRFPNSILYCENEEDVVRGLGFAAKRGLAVRVRSGGHNYEGFCVGNGVMVIDTSRLKSRKVFKDHPAVQIGSGVDNRELYRFLNEYGYPFPSGTCPTVGAVGLTQGGGWGHSARIFGLACDSLLEAELVDACGRFLVVNKDTHPDLFWALRGGGGGNFGVVTSLKYRLPRKLFLVTYVDIQYNQIQEETVRRFFNAWQLWLSGDDVRFTPNSRIFNSAKDGMGIYLRGFYYGPPEEAKHSLQPFLELSGAKATFRATTFWEATEIDASFYPHSEQFRFGGRFMRGNLSQNQIKSVLSLVRERAEGATYASVALYALGGKVSGPAPSATAFFYRDANYIIGIETVWDNPAAEQESLAWIDPRFQYLQSITAGSYINFPYLRTDHYMQAYYGENAKRLIRIKRRYDPNNRFRFAQSIRPLLPYR